MASQAAACLHVHIINGMRVVGLKQPCNGPCVPTRPPQRREMLGLPPGDTDPMLDDMSDEEPKFEEPMELVDARARLAALVAARGADAMSGGKQWQG